MGGTMKGAHMHAAYSNSRRRWSNIYVVMVIVCCVFGCGILGLIGLHRLRERSSFNLLIKEKDDKILSLHLLLQKEREHTVEVKRNAEEMKMKVMSLGSQRSELESKISEMQSTISSLREEQRAVEFAFQEKQNEEKLMREKQQTQVSDENLQVAEALREELRQKQGEIEDLQRRLQLRGGAAEANATQSAGTKDAFAETESSTTSTETEAIHTSSENGGTNAAEDRASDEVKVEPESKKEGENGKIADDQESQMQENSHRFRGKHGYLRRAKGKRWRSIGKQTQGKRTSLSNAASTMADQGTEELSRSALRNSTHASLEELARSSAMRRDGVQQHTQEDEQPVEQISIAKPAEEKNEHTDLLVRKEAAETHGEEEDGVQSRDSEESEDQEETNEPEF